VILVSEPATLEPIVIDTIERYFDRLQAHVSASQMIEHVVTEDFETGFTDGFHWRGPDGLAEFSRGAFSVLRRVARGVAGDECQPSR
jgi:hypothetical protein